MSDRDDPEGSSLKDELKRAMMENRDNVIPFPNPKKKKGSSKSAGVNINGDRNVVGDNNLLIEGDAHFNSKVIQRTTVQASPEHITPAQAHRLQNLVKEAVTAEAASGQQTEKSLFAKWYDKLRDKYAVNSYILIPAEHGDQAINWMQRQVAMLRPKLRRTDNQAWRNQHYKAIWSRAKELGFTKDQVYALSGDRLGKTITSLKQLRERNLKSLYNIIMSLPK